MTIRGYSPLALLAALLVLAALGLAGFGAGLENWHLLAAAGVSALCSLTCAALSAFDG